VRGTFPAGPVRLEVGSVAVLAGEVLELLLNQCPGLARELLVLVVLRSREIVAAIELGGKQGAERSPTS
jgi:hypothetical protein